MDIINIFYNIIDSLSYVKTEPMLFNSGLFLLFFTIFFAGYIFVYRHIDLRLVYVVTFSLFFYYKSSGEYVLLLIAVILFNYLVARYLVPSEDNPQQKRQKKALLIVSIVTNLSFLLYFKYTNFILSNILSSFEPLDVFVPVGTTFKLQTLSDFQALNIFLPIGISFFTFQTISYLVDVYKKDIEPCNNLLDFAFYLSFFPQLVAGPIVRAKDFLPQIRRKIEFKDIAETPKDAAILDDSFVVEQAEIGTTNFTRKRLGEGLFMILKGFIKKAIIADFVAQYATLIYGDVASYSGFENLMAMYAFTLQIYCDFSGYSDMAIGLALLLGFQLPDNFRSPYQALNITDFWRRWHISLSSWLRDYIYIPLGGNRGGGWGAIVTMGLFMLLGMFLGGWWIIFIYIPLIAIAKLVTHNNPSRTIKLFMYMNLTITMLVGGWWHGADWKFVFWGGMHGVGLVVHKLWKTYVSPKPSKNAFVKGVAWFVTFHFVAFLWVYFRADSFEIASTSIAKIFTDFDLAYLNPFCSARPMLVTLMVIGFGIHFVSKLDKEKMSTYFASMPLLLKALAFLVMIQLSLQLELADVAPFIYFQF